MRGIGFFRFVVAFLALGFAMASSAALLPETELATPALSTSGDPAGMPCHENVNAASSALDAMDGAFGSGHACCVLACLVMPPFVLAGLDHPLPRAFRLMPAPQVPLRGHSVALPTPPPRFS